MKKSIVYIFIPLILFFLSSCIEEFDAATTEFDDIIVIEATVTNELKRQRILLSRTFRFEDNGPINETGATVEVMTSTNNRFSFTEASPGTYLSDIEFRAEPGISYQLSVSTSNGRTYISKDTQLTSNSSRIDNVYALKEIDENGAETIGIYVDSSDPTNSSRFYGFEFEETYRIIAPYWVPNGFIVTNQDPFQFTVGRRTQEERVCYATVNSKGRLVTNTDLLQEDRVSQFLIKSIPTDDIRLSSRYSIEVQQYTQSNEAYNFYRTMNSLSNSESLFSQIQPGFLAGNISSVDDPDEKILGFFEVSSVTKERLFFNRFEFINEPYPLFCNITAPSRSILSTFVRFNLVEYYADNVDPSQGGPYFVVQRGCGDCTVFGSNVRPSFWVD